MRPIQISAALITTLLLLAACGGPEPTLGVSVSPTAGTLVPGGTVTFELTLERNETATEPVTLSVEGLPDGVTATLAPATLSGDASTSTLTLSATRDSPREPVNLTLTAQAGPDLVASASLALAVQGLTVTGLVSALPGIPLPGVTVWIVGSPPTLTAGDGTFTIADVALPYDLTVAAIPMRLAHTYLGLTSADLRLTPFFEPVVTSAFQANVSGTLTGAGSPVPVGQEVRVAAASSTPTFGRARVSSGGASYAFQPAWATLGPVQATLHALQWTLTDGAVQRYVGYGTASATLTRDAVIDAPISMGAAPETTTVTPIREVPAGLTVLQTGATLRLGAAATMPIPFGAAAPSSFLMPLLPGATYDTYAQASGPDGSYSLAWDVGAAPGEVPVLRLPAPVAPIAPAEGAVDVTAESGFTVSNPAGGALTFQFEKSSSPSERRWVTTLETTARIPDLAEIGFPLAAGASFEWQVLNQPGHTTANASVTGDGSFGGYLGTSIGATNGGPGASAPGGMAISSRRTFQTR